MLIDFNVASSNQTNKDFVGTNPYLAPDIIADNYKVNWDLSADTFARSNFCMSWFVNNIRGIHLKCR